MRHRVFGKKLGRNYNERKALFNSLTKAIFINGSINTTKARAQAVVSIVESLSTTIMTKPELIAKRELFRVLQNQTWVNNVVTKFKEVFADQTSNFTKITLVKRRFGDDSLIVNLSFVKPIKFDIKKEVKVEDKKEAKPKKNVKKIVTAKKVKKETK